jgi:hypothetical protein
MSRSTPPGCCAGRYPGRSCGATIGVEPRCDFGCSACYLTADAKTVPRGDREETSRQLNALVEHLGPKANLQLTDGELTLLPESELFACVAEARHLGAIPMLMTHGDAFRRRPGLLERLIEASLTEVSIHVDSSQRGRPGYGTARSEAELEPLRDELAERIRIARRVTGIRLRAATTVTVTRATLDELPGVVTWCLANSDVFGLLSLQPLAPVGRTREGLEGVGADAPWKQISTALAPFGVEPGGRSALDLGHPDCTRVEPFLVAERPGHETRLLPMVRRANGADEALAGRYLGCGLGGLAFRNDPPVVRAARTLGALARAPRFVFAELAPWLAARCEKELRRSLGGGVALDLALGRLELRSFQVVSHHFMSADELRTARGRERLAACLFRVPVARRLAPMCEVNAGGLRAAFYAALSGPRRERRGAPDERAELPAGRATAVC